MTGLTYVVLTSRRSRARAPGFRSASCAANMSRTFTTDIADEAVGEITLRGPFVCRLIRSGEHHARTYLRVALRRRVVAGIVLHRAAVPLPRRRALLLAGAQTPPLISVDDHDVVVEVSEFERDRVDEFREELAGTRNVPTHHTDISPSYLEHVRRHIFSDAVVVYLPSGTLLQVHHSARIRGLRPARYSTHRQNSCLKLLKRDEVAAEALCTPGRKRARAGMLLRCVNRPSKS